MIVKEIQQVVLNCLKDIIHDGILDNEQNLLELGMDSMNYIRLVVELEDEFNIEIKDEDILLDNFSSVNKINELLGQYSITNN